MSDPNPIEGTENNESLYGTTGADLIQGRGGHDYLYGYEGNDVLAGGAGDDYLSGGTGDDVYRLEMGFGQDQISETSGFDVIEFGAGIAPAETIVWRSGDALFLRVGSDTVQIYSFFYGSNSPIEEVRFVDGTIWTRDVLVQRALLPSDESQSLYGTSGDDALHGAGGDDNIYGGGGQDELYGDVGRDGLYGEGGNDTLYGGDGNDWMEGGVGNDVLEGGEGDDRLMGGEGDDTYKFEVGFGRDTINNYGSAVQQDVIEFGEGLSAANARVVRDYMSLRIEFSDQPGSSVLLYYMLDGEASEQIKWVRFADGTQWDTAELIRQSTLPNDSDQELYGTSGADVLDGGGGNDTIRGEGGDDELIGGTGDDLLWGGDGNDTVHGGDGNDNLYDYAGDNAMYGGAGDDYIVGGTGNEQLVGGDGNDTLIADSGDDILIGGAGDDNINGNEGNDIYRFEVGFGHDSLTSSDSYSDGVDTDVIEFGEGLLAADMRFERVANDRHLKITFVGHPDDSLTINWFFDEPSGSDNMIDEVRFADGTVWDTTTLMAQILRPTDDAQVLRGTSRDDVIDGGGGNDQLDGRGGNDTLIGGEGSDSLYGGDGNDVLQGGKGNDYLSHGSGDDIIRYDLGDGYDSTSLESGNDGVEFGAGLTTDDVLVYLDGGYLFFEMLQDGGTLQVGNYYWGTPLAWVRFADGTLWNAADLVANTLAMSWGTEGNDIVHGTAGGDVLRGYGGTDWLIAHEGNDTLESGLGNDTLDGGTGSDTYRFDGYWGRDVIRETDNSGTDSDRIVFGAGVDAAQVAVASSGYDLTLTNLIDGGVITVSNFFIEGGGQQIEQVRFADRSTWQLDDLYLMQMVGTDANQTIHGRSADDTIEAGLGDDVVLGNGGDDLIDGGAGNDRLKGGAGSDTYRFAAGWGDDIVEGAGEAASAQDADTIAFGEGIVDGDITVSSDFYDLVIRHASGDRITLTDYFRGGDRVQQVTFVDGTVWNVDEIIVRQLQGTDGDQFLHGSSLADTVHALDGMDVVFGHGGNDTLNGGAGDDTLDGGAGNDTLDGGDGNDFFLFGRGSGQDRVLSADPDGAYWDVVQLGEGIAAEDIVVTREGRDIVLSIVDSDDRLTLVDFIPATEDGWPTAIEEIWFNDGTTWDAWTLMSMAPEPEVPGLIEGTEGNDELWGTEGDDTIDGRAGVDWMSGGRGNDVYYVDTSSDYVVEAAGEGIDEIRATSSYNMDSWSGLRGANVENLTLLGNADLTGFGNELGNLINGNNGNNHIHAAGGDNTVHGNGGDDRIYAYDGIDHLFGDDGNDILDGGAGADRLEGGSGDDTYYVDNVGDVVVEQADQGGDNVITRVSYQLPDHVDNMTLAEDAGAIDGVGNAQDNYLSGNADANLLDGGGGADILSAGLGDDTLIGGEGNDYLYGGGGNDVLQGGAGDDTYDRIEAGDQLVELDGGGVDTIKVDRNYVLPEHFENLVLIGSALNGTGNALDNLIIGNGLDNLIDGGDGNDVIYGGSVLNTAAFGTGFDALRGGTGDDLLCGWWGEVTSPYWTGHYILEGGAGNDTLMAMTDRGLVGMYASYDGGTGDDQLLGNGGADTYLFARGDGNDTVVAGTATQAGDVLQFGTGIEASDVSASRTGDNLTLTIDADGGSITMVDWYAAESNRLLKATFADGSELGTAQLEALVGAMASFAAPQIESVAYHEVTAAKFDLAVHHQLA